MDRSVSRIAVAVGLALVVTVGPPSVARSEESGPRDIPAAFAPLEYLVGSWKGQARPRERSSNQFRGWEEIHSWAWSFVKGKPVGLAVTAKGSKVLITGKLSHGGSGPKPYHFQATGPTGGALQFEGAFDGSGKMLVLDQTAPEGKTPPLRITLRPNANLIRYTMVIETKESPVRFAPMIEAGLTKEGESLAGGGTTGTTADGPKCIVTGGAAAMTLNYQGRTFPICCTGCRDEFNDNPEKYIKKAAALLRSAQEAQPKGDKPRTPRASVSRNEDDFASDISPMTTEAKPGATTDLVGGANKSAQPAPAPVAANDGESDLKKTKDAGKPVDTKSANRAASLLRVAQNLEKSGKTEAALKNFRQIVKDFPGTASAKTATERIKILENP